MRVLRELVGSPWQRMLTVAGGFAVALSMAACLPWWGATTGTLAYALAGLTGTVAAMVAARTATHRRFGWWLMSAALAIQLVNYVAFAVYLIVAQEWPRHAWVSKLASASAFFLLAWGLAWLVSGQRCELRQRLTDAVIMAGAAITVLWVFGHNTTWLNELPDPSWQSLGGHLDELLFLWAMSTLLAVSCSIVLYPNHARSPVYGVACGMTISAAWMKLVALDLVQSIGFAAAPMSAGALTVVWYVASGKHQQRPTTTLYTVKPLVAQSMLMGAALCIAYYHWTQNPAYTLPSLVLAAMVAFVSMRNQAALDANHTLLRALAAREGQMSHQARHDGLTDLHNRETFHAILRSRLTAQPRTTVTVVFADLDGFKGVNDTHGHLVGDKLLQQCARRLQALFPNSPSVARLAGDEFAVILINESDDHSAARRVVTAMNDAFVLDTARVTVSVSVGVCHVPPSSPSPSPHGVLHDADLAMYHVKRHGRNGIHVFDPATDKFLLDDRTLGPAFAQALGQHEVLTYFQPIVRVGTGEVVAFEALSRWHHRGMRIPPARFVHVAEKAGLLDRLTDVVLERACAHIAQLTITQPGVDLRVGVNVGGYSLRDPDFVARVMSAIERHGIGPRSLCLELTESLPVDEPSGAIDTLRALRDAHIDVVLDDFGTGYNSMSRLLALPLSGIKVDRTMLEDIHEDRARREVVSSIARLAERLQLSVVAEGVEHPEQYRILRELGIPYAQGYLFGPPSPAQVWLRPISHVIPTQSQSPTSAH